MIGVAALHLEGEMAVAKVRVQNRDAELISRSKDPSAAGGCRECKAPSEQFGESPAHPRDAHGEAEHERGKGNLSRVAGGPGP